MYLDIDAPVFDDAYRINLLENGFKFAGNGFTRPLDLPSKTSRFAIVFNSGLQKKSLLGSEDVGVSKRLSIPMSILA